jgi:hypothetical protein
MNISPAPRPCPARLCEACTGYCRLIACSFITLPDRHFLADEVGVVLQVQAGDRLHAKRGDAGGGLRVLAGFGEGSVDPQHDVLRQVRRAGHQEPVGDHDVREAELAQGRDLRELRRTVVRGHCDAADLAPLQAADMRAQRVPERDDFTRNDARLRLRRALERHMREPHAGLAREQCAGEMSDASGTAVGEGLRRLLRGSHEVLDGLDRRLGTDRDQDRRTAEHVQVGEILDHVVRWLLEQHLRDGGRAGGGHQKRVAIGRCLRDHCAADRTAGTGPALDDQLRPQSLLDALGAQPHQQVGGAARSKRVDHADRTLGPLALRKHWRGERA